MKTQLFTTLFFVATLFCIGCSDNAPPQDQLPPITQTGANTFGAIVDGKIFIPKDSYTFTPGSSERKGLTIITGQGFSNSNGDDKWIIKANNYKDTPETYIYIYLPTLKENRTNHIIDLSDGSESSNLSNAHIYSLIDLGNRQYRSFDNSGIFNFSRLDIENGIYAGTFSVKLKNKDNENDVIEITDGRFDINLNTVNN